LDLNQIFLEMYVNLMDQIVNHQEHNHLFDANNNI
jgi:hypothetical protein